MSLRDEKERLEGDLAGLEARYRRTLSELETMRRSRWWRLNPRRLIERSPRRDTAAAAAEPAPELPVIAARGDDGRGLSRFRDDVMQRGEFSVDWFTDRAEQWEVFIRDLEGRSARVLEIGSFEGLSTCYVLWRLPEAVVTCVDTFKGSIEHAPEKEPGRLERRFDANVALVDETRVRKRRGDSRRVLLDLLEEDDLFDLVYVDGSHRALDVIIDAALAWQLLEPRGVLVFDDYRWTRFEEPLLRPAPAIDAFVGIVSEHAETLFIDLQVGLRRRA